LREEDSKLDVLELSAGRAAGLRVVLAPRELGPSCCTGPCSEVERLRLPSALVLRYLWRVAGVETCVSECLAKGTDGIPHTMFGLRVVLAKKRVGDFEEG